MITKLSVIFDDLPSEVNSILYIYNVILTQRLLKIACHKPSNLLTFAGNSLHKLLFNVIKCMSVGKICC